LPAYGPVPPGIWTYDDRLAKPARDVAAAKGLIESSGWTRGRDGIYLKDGKPLAATIYLRTDQSERIKFAEILSRQVRDCGIDLKPSQSDFNGGLQGIFSWPNHAPDTDQPFDLYLITLIPGWEPVPDFFGSDQITTQANPDGANFGGFSDPRVDDLLHRIETTYSPDLRANLSRQLQEVLAEQQPALFAWHYSRAAAAAVGLRTLNGPLDLDSPRWYAFPERLVLERSGGA
jgi:peptide/nickel transport system substrate-binding protein